MSMDMVNMYPSMRLSLIKKALCHHCFRYLSKEESVANDDEKGDIDVNGLEMEAYESAFCANMCDPYIFEVTETELQ
eukprot:2964975-Ditylum_brightwellii.AAC.1